MTEREWGYVAGIVDGEGSISVERRTAGKRYPVYMLAVVISNTDLRLLTWLQTRLGGSIVPKATPPVERNWRWQYQLQWRAAEAVQLLQQLQSGLVIKQAQAFLGLEFATVLQSRIGRTFTMDQRDQLERFYHAMRQLNVRGRNRLVDAERLSERDPRVAAGDMR